MYIKYSRTRDVKEPRRGHIPDAGLDFFLPNDYEEIVIEAGKSVLIDSGIKVEIPVGFCGILMNKSSVASKMRIIVGSALVDSFYSGNIRIDLHNISDKNVTLEPGMKIAQMILIPIITPQLIEEKDDSKLYENAKKMCDDFRDQGGFGSTGNK